MAGFGSAATFMVKEGGTAPYFTNLDTALWTAATYGGTGHVIEVYPGTYPTDIDLTVPSNVSAIIGVGGADSTFFVNPNPPTWITATGKDFLDVFGSVDLTISGLNVSGYRGAIVTKGVMATGLTVENCVFNNNLAAFYGGTNGGTFSNLAVSNGWIGISVVSYAGGENLDNNVIENCTFTGITRAPAVFLDHIENDIQSPAAAAAASIANNQILGCTISECSDYGMVLTAASNVTVDGCTIFDVEFAAIGAFSVNNGWFTNNVIYGCAQSDTNPDSTDLTWGTPLGAISLYSCYSIDIEYNDIYDNGGLGTMGGGTGFAEYAVGADNGTTSNRIRYNCLWGHDGIQGWDDGSAASNVWRYNYYSGLAGTTYALDGSAGEIDNSPTMFNASAHAAGSTYEVFDYVDVTFDWTVPSCDPWDSVGLATYSFTVNFDPAVLEFVPGSADYNYGYLGDPDPTVYAPVGGDPASGTLIFEAATYEGSGYGDATLAFAQFQVIGIGNTQITINSLYTDSLDVLIMTDNTPLDLTLEDNVNPAISFTANNPVRDDIYSWGSPYVYTPDEGYKLLVDISATDQYKIDHVWYRFDGLGWCGLASSINADTYTNTGYHANYIGCPIPITPVAGVDDGTVPHTLEIGVWDAGGNFASQTYTFYIDWTCPTFTSWTMADPTCPVNPDYTNDLTVNLTYVDDGTAVQVEFWSGGSWSGVRETYPKATFDLTAGDGTKTHYARLYDEFLNRSPHRLETIELDQTAPAPHDAWLVVDPTPAKTGVRDIVGDCNFEAASGTMAYIVSEDLADADCASTKWAAMPPPVRPVPMTLSANDGLKTVYFMSRDDAGNVGYTSAQIEFDSTNNGFDQFSINDRSGCTDNRRIRVEFSWSDTDIAYVGLSNNQGGPYTQYDATVYTDSILWNMVNTEGWHTVYGVLIDNIGNYGAESLDSIFLDLTAPTATGITLDDGLGEINWSQTAVVNVEVADPSTDIIQVMAGEVSGTYTVTEAFPPNPFAYDFGTPTEGTLYYLYVQAQDCAGRLLTSELTDAIRFDFTDPVISDVLIDGGATYCNSTTVSVNFTYTESYRKYVYLSEDPAMAGATPLGWGAGPYSFTLSTGDGTKTVYVQTEDRSGRLSTIESATIILDTEAPTGTMTVQQDPVLNPLAAPGYTNSQTGNEIVGIAYPGDAVDMQIINDDWSGNTGWIPVANTFNPWTLKSATDGVYTIRIRFRDMAANVGAWYNATIELDQLAPAPATNFHGTPTASVHLTWDGATEDQYYFFRYNATFDYPIYTDGPAPAPALDEGFYGDVIYGTEYDFGTYPEMDMLTFSLWTVDKAGNTSSTFAFCSATNYLLGDFDFSGVLEFVEFGDIAASYYLTSADAGFCQACDFGPTADGEPDGLPVPDGYVGFDELTIFAYNYSIYGDHLKDAAKLIGADQIAVSTEVPYLKAGDEATFSIDMTGAEGVLAYHLNFAIDAGMVEIVNVQQGDIAAVNGRGFYNQVIDGNSLDLTGAVLSDVFEGSSIATVTVRAKKDGAFDINLVESSVKSADLSEVSVDFSVAKGAALPDSYYLGQNYPNPFNPTTTINFSMREAGHYNLTVFNVAGQVVESFNGYADAGTVSITWNASGVGSGVYFYKLQAADFTDTKKMVLLK